MGEPETQEPDAPEPSEGPGSRKRRLLFLSVSGVGLVAGLVAFRGVIFPFLLAIIIAYVLAPLVSRLETHVPRWFAVLGIYAALLGAISIFGVISVPRLAAEVEKLARDTPRMVKKVRDVWVPDVVAKLRSAADEYGLDEETETPPDSNSGTGTDGQPSVRAPAPPPKEKAARTALTIDPQPDGSFHVRLPKDGLRVREQAEGLFVIETRTPLKAERGSVEEAVTDAVSGLMENTQHYAFEAIKTVQGVLKVVVRSVFGFAIVLMLSAYILVTSDRIFAFMRTFVLPRRQRNFDLLLKRIDRGLSGVVRGQLLIALVNGVLTGIALWIIGVQYWPTLTLIATLLSIIPIFGAILSTIPAVLIGLQDGLSTAFWVFVAIVVIHQLEANVFNPKIMGDAAKVHPVLVVFALLAGEHLFGIAGALLAVPILSITQSLFLHFREVALGVPAPRASMPPPPPSG